MDKRIVDHGYFSRNIPRKVSFVRNVVEIVDNINLPTENYENFERKKRRPMKAVDKNDGNLMENSFLCSNTFLSSPHTRFSKPHLHNYANDNFNKVKSNSSVQLTEGWLKRFCAVRAKKTAGNSPSKNVAKRKKELLKKQCVMAKEKIFLDKILVVLNDLFSVRKQSPMSLNEIRNFVVEKAAALSYWFMHNGLSILNEHFSQHLINGVEKWGAHMVLDKEPDLAAKTPNNKDSDSEDDNANEIIDICSTSESSNSVVSITPENRSNASTPCIVSLSPSPTNQSGDKDNAAESSFGRDASLSSVLNGIFKRFDKSALTFDEVCRLTAADATELYNTFSNEWKSILMNELAKMSTLHKIRVNGKDQWTMLGKSKNPSSVQQKNFSLNPRSLVNSVITVAGEQCSDQNLIANDETALVENIDKNVESTETCKLSGCFYRNSDSYSQHAKVFHKNSRFKCRLCKKLFSFYSIASNHVRLNHADFWKSQTTLASGLKKLKSKTGLTDTSYLEYLKTKRKRLRKVKNQADFNSAIVKMDSLKTCVLERSSSENVRFYLLKRKPSQKKFRKKTNSTDFHLCKLCHKRFCEHVDYYHHMKEEYLGLKFLCIFCEKPFYSCYSVKHHIKHQHGRTANNLKSVEEKTISGAPVVEDHVTHKKVDLLSNKTHSFRQIDGLQLNKDDAFGCKYCCKSFDTEKEHTTRTDREHTGWRLKCSLCSSKKSYKLYRGLKLHLRRFHGVTTYLSTFCTHVRFPRSAKVVKNVQNKTSAWNAKCTACSASFKNADDLRDHMIQSVSCLNSAHVCLLPKTKRCKTEVSNPNSVAKNSENDDGESVADVSPDEDREDVELVTPSATCIVNVVPHSEVSLSSCLVGKQKPKDSSAELGIYGAICRHVNRTRKWCPNGITVPMDTIEITNLETVVAASALSDAHPSLSDDSEIQILFEKDVAANVTVDENDNDNKNDNVKYYMFAIPADLLNSGSLMLSYHPFEKSGTTPPSVVPITVTDSNQVISNLPITCTPVISDAYFTDKDFIDAKSIRDVLLSGKNALVSASTSSAKDESADVLNPVVENARSDVDLIIPHELKTEENDVEECVEVPRKSTAPPPIVLSNIVSLNENGRKEACIRRNYEECSTVDSEKPNDSGDLVKDDIRPEMPTVSDVCSLPRQPSNRYAAGCGSVPNGRYVIRLNGTINYLSGNNRLSLASVKDNTPYLIPNLSYVNSAHYEHPYCK